MIYNFHTNQFENTTTFSNKPFIIGSDITLTQQEVYELHLKFKKIILDLNIPKGHPVCIYGGKEVLFPVAMITLLSLNIPYVPIDEIMPDGRIENIKNQTNSKVLINCSFTNCKVPFEISISNNLSVKKTNEINNFPVLEIENTNDPLRYIIFTSGSTGEPKGVQATHFPLCNFADWFLTWPLITEETIFMNQSSFGFDVSVCELLACFSKGSTLVLNHHTVLKQPLIFLERLINNKATTLFCTPSFISMYLTIAEFNAENYPSINQFVFIGEELPVNTVKKISQKFPNSKVVNSYGPTETTVVTTYIDVTKEILEQHPKSLPISSYIRSTTNICIIDEDKETGVGEIGLMGPHLSIGYLNDIEKTNAAFVYINNIRTYKTGDLGYIKNGFLYYMGRNDNQIKLNGYRIELEEITNKLLTHTYVTNAATIPLKTNGVTKKIISFVISSHSNSGSLLETELKSYLANHVPSYMVPSEILFIEAFPLNSNYKTDKKALLEHYFSLN